MGNTSSFTPSGLFPEDSVTKKGTERGESALMGIKYAASGMKGFRLTMEDQHIHQVGIPVHGQEDHLDNHAIFAVFDGHGGDFTSNFLKRNFLDVLSKREELAKYAALPETGTRGQSDVNAIILLQKALVKTFIQLDEQLLPLQKERTTAIQSGNVTPPCSSDRNDHEDLGSIRIPPVNSKSAVGERSGSTGVVVLITPSHILCANTGDSRAVLRRKGNTLPLSFDHKPSDLPERLRITDFGGIVKGRRVNGDLAVSRAFGDFTYKTNQVGRVLATRQKVIVVPDIIVYPRDHANDEFIVLACDGVWDVASNKQCTEFVQRLLSEGESDMGNICEETLDTCLDRRSRDNMTMVLVGLPGMNIETSRRAVMSNALWGHRAARHARNVANSTISSTQEGCSFVGKHIMDRARPVMI
jgi:serine/threonine protein phosphatase PrpC